jgi:hypothetical protein
MSNRLNNVDLITESGWVKFDKSWSGKFIHYIFKCSLKPIICISKGNLQPIELGEEHRLTHFELITNMRGDKLNSVFLGRGQKHPHKDPQTHELCLGKLRGVEISTQLVSMIVDSLQKYDADDCFCLPDSCNLRKFEERHGG